jgi:hypothetical protein
MRVRRWILVSLPLLALAAWGLSYGVSVAAGVPIAGADVSLEVCRGNLTLRHFPVPGRPFYDVDPRPRVPSLVGWAVQYGRVQSVMGFTWGGGAVGRFWTMPLWFVVVASALPAWVWRPRRRRPRGRGFAVEAAGTSR